MLVCREVLGLDVKPEAGHAQDGGSQYLVGHWRSVFLSGPLVYCCPGVLRGFRRSATLNLPGFLFVGLQDQAPVHIFHSGQGCLPKGRFATTYYVRLLAGIPPPHAVLQLLFSVCGDARGFAEEALVPGGLIN